MKGKHKIINRKVRAAQKNSRVIDPKQLAACEGKIRHSKKEAYDRAKEMGTTKAYRCRFCKYYHVGRKP